mmetsp:Transcript_43517/g.100162  ORF Transcript_43517/g.100162 Transcript_43517/m.100162 type:complete len:620 (+) Transcript_43517:34-1893(+)
MPPAMQRKFLQIHPPRLDDPIGIPVEDQPMCWDRDQAFLLDQQFTNMQTWMRGQFHEQLQQITEVLNAKQHLYNDHAAHATLLGITPNYLEQVGAAPLHQLNAGQTMSSDPISEKAATLTSARCNETFEVSPREHAGNIVQNRFERFMLRMSKSRVGTGALYSENTPPVRHSKMKEDWEGRMERHLKNLGTRASEKVHTQPPHTLLWRIVHGYAFGILVAIVIAVNAACIGVEVEDAMMQVLDDGTWEKSSRNDAIFKFCTAFFMVELLLRIISERLSFLFGEEWRWNLFDAVVVMFSVVDSIVDLLNVSAGEQPDDGLLSSPGYLRVLKTFRMVRVLRIIRVLRFFRELRRMCMSIASAMVSLAWALVFLYLIIYIFAIFFMQAGIDALTLDDESTILNSTDAAAFEEWERIRSDWRKWYGSLGGSLFTLTKAISGGDDWGSMTDPLRAESPFYVIAFMFFVLFVVIGVLNVLTGVFLGSAAEVLLKDRDWVTEAESIKAETFAKNFYSLFQEMDLSRDGKLHWNEFSHALTRKETQAFFVANGLDLTDAHLVFSLIAGESSVIAVDDFVTGCSKMKGTAKSVQMISLFRETEYMLQELKRLASQVSAVYETQCLAQT